MARLQQYILHYIGIILLLWTLKELTLAYTYTIVIVNSRYELAGDAAKKSSNFLPSTKTTKRQWRQKRTIPKRQLNDHLDFYSIFYSFLTRWGQTNEGNKGKRKKKKRPHKTILIYITTISFHKLYHCVMKKIGYRSLFVQRNKIKGII